MTEQTAFMPEYEPNAQECASLYEIYRQPGFAVLQRMFQSQVDMFAKAAMNLPLNATDAEIASLFKQAKAATQFYAGVALQIDIALRTARFQSEVPMTPAEAKDDTEQVLDMDDMAGALDGLPSFF